MICSVLTILINDDLVDHIFWLSLQWMKIELVEQKTHLISYCFCVKRTKAEVNFLGHRVINSLHFGCWETHCKLQNFHHYTILCFPLISDLFLCLIVNVLSLYETMVRFTLGYHSLFIAYTHSTKNMIRIHNIKVHKFLKLISYYSSTHITSSDFI